MRVKALKSFSGIISMYAGEERDIQTKAVLDDLTSAGYIRLVEQRRGSKNEGKRDKPE